MINTEKIIGKFVDAKTKRKQDNDKILKIRKNMQGKRCNRGHLLQEEYEDSNGKIWRWDCPICIEDMNKIRRGESSEFN